MNPATDDPHAPINPADAGDARQAATASLPKRRPPQRSLMLPLQEKRR